MKTFPFQKRKKSGRVGVREEGFLVAINADDPVLRGSHLIKLLGVLSDHSLRKEF